VIERARTATADLLVAAARAIHAERDPDRLTAWVADALQAATGASTAGLCLHMDPGAPFWVTATGASRNLGDLGDPRTLAPLAAALRGHGARWPAENQLHRLLGVETLHVAAIPRADGGTYGLALLAWERDPGEEREDARLITETLVAHLGVALDNLAAVADLEAAQRGIVHKLQEAVRPPTPSVPQTELGVYYVPAEHQAPTGGDLYDWLLLPDGELHLAVLDVMGKGVAATKDAVSVTHALRLLVLDGCPLDKLIARADELVGALNPELVATLLVGRYNPATGVMRLVGGGHPPAFVVTGGRVKEVSAGGIPIGWPGAGSEGQRTVVLDRSDTMIFYTDGLIETTKDVVAGLAALSRFATETAGYPAPALARALVERALEGAARHDDSLALVLRRRNPPSGARLPLAPLEYRFTPSTATVPLVRHFLQDWLVRVPVDSDEADDLLLVATELCANALRYSTGARGGIALRAWADGADVVLEVEDDGGALQEIPQLDDDQPDPLAERGRGLFLVRALTDELTGEVDQGRTVFRAVRRAVVGNASGREDAGRL
jgi:serine phosphatase RsbU (regulator of sigma subunit)/anti-sigma regulatory factor (Ser/Thr protein kinase)